MTERGPRSAPFLTALGICAVLIFTGLVALGLWQVERRAWKLDLIDKVDQRVHAQPVAAPGPGQWSQVSAASDEYRRVSATGTLLLDRETLVQATTAIGGGYWVLTPLQRADGSIVLINRGFVPPERRDRANRGDDAPTGETTITGLLRITEPGGSFLRHNDPAANRWYSRDVQAIAAARGLDQVAPFFIDEAAPAGQSAASPKAQAWPVAGLTVISFPNNHLSYAFTWFALALMVVAAAWYVGRDELRVRRARMREDARHD
ncbi:SURF1 family protein [Variovorax sp. Sphag1AA]|uniref:SURF1 family protein n=1 Tax=Variovorax sp. Sphag1AA TaxID=2587027 RepID=UPI00160D072E|nr:SURF1 family protein [Variovorax sp. Sphag1AA]MBB3177637.1 surfeit locus 1 family protein [Variovorax sp. Sphag1AA]